MILPSRFVVLTLLLLSLIILGTTTTPLTAYKVVSSDSLSTRLRSRVPGMMFLWMRSFPADNVRVIGWLPWNDSFIDLRLYRGVLLEARDYYGGITAYINLTSLTENTGLKLRDIIVSPQNNGSLIAVAAYTPETGYSYWSLFILNLSRSGFSVVANYSLTNMLGTVIRVDKIAWSPSGELLAVAYDYSYVGIIDTSGNLYKNIKTNGYRFMAWLNNHRLIVLPPRNNTFIVLDYRVGITNRVIVPSSGECSSAEILVNTLNVIPGGVVTGFYQCGSSDPVLFAADLLGDEGVSTYHLKPPVPVGNLWMKTDPDGTTAVIYAEAFRVSMNESAPIAATSGLILVNYTKLQLGENPVEWVIDPGVYTHKTPRDVDLSLEKPVWSPDGLFIAAIDPLTIMHRSGFIVSVGVLPGVMDEWAMWSPTGKYVLVGSTHVSPGGEFYLNLTCYKAPIEILEENAYIEIHAPYEKVDNALRSPIVLVVDHQTREALYVANDNIGLLTNESVIPLYTEPGSYTIYYRPLKCWGPYWKGLNFTVKALPGRRVLINFHRASFPAGWLNIMNNLGETVTVYISWGGAGGYRVYDANKYDPDTCGFRAYTPRNARPGAGVEVGAGETVKLCMVPGKYSLLIKPIGEVSEITISPGEIKGITITQTGTTAKTTMPSPGTTPTATMTSGAINKTTQTGKPSAGGLPISSVAAASVIVLVIVILILVLKKR